MSRVYEIFSLEDLLQMYLTMANYQKKVIDSGKPFQKMKITSKRWRKPKTSAQHKTYWRCIGEMQKALLETGNVYSDEELHEFVKLQSGFTKKIIILGKEQTVTKSIADDSEDVDIENINSLIDWIINWCREFLNYEIQIGEV